MVISPKVYTKQEVLDIITKAIVETRQDCINRRMVCTAKDLAENIYLDLGNKSIIDLET